MKMSFIERRKFLWLLFLIGLALIAAVANATTLARLKFSDLAEQATAIVRVRCIGSTSHWKNGEIWTRTSFAVEEQSKGQLPLGISVEMPGGIVGHLHARVDEVPAFAPNDEAYLFLWTAPGGEYRILGWSQGAFRIRTNPQTGLQMVTQDSAAAPLFDPVSRQFRSGGIRNVPIAAFQLKLKRALESRP
jgi:hypothetical protein